MEAGSARTIKKHGVFFYIGWFLVIIVALFFGTAIVAGVMNSELFHDPARVEKLDCDNAGSIILKGSLCVSGS
jgi:hypothetical protein